ncbi:MAG: hypothetical protein KBH53_01780 [Methanoculleus sp.]|nr:hypothetical protein [Methanoculleus sp.]
MDLLSSGDAGDLIAYLAAESSLAGPRTNQDLTEAFARAIREFAVADREDRRILWDLCVELACISPEDAPTSEPHESLSVCGVRGIAAMGTVSPGCVKAALRKLAESAEDPRWRVRDAVAIGLRDLLARHRDVTVSELNGWVEGGSWSAMQTVAAGVADADLLREPDLAEAALLLHRKIMIRVYTAGERESEDFQALRKTLGCTLSRVVAALPSSGFEYLQQVSTLDDQEIRWIVRENLKDNHLAGDYPETVRHIQAQIG